jgi:GNAT superfamily N-acetyltransferase
MSNITLRPATEADIPTLIAVFTSAFSNTPLTLACFPETDPAVQADHRKIITRSLPEILCAVDSSDTIHGWCRWVRKPAAPVTPIVVSADDFPAAGDQELARRFFQTNVDTTAKIVQGRDHWFLSYIVVRNESKGMGVGKVMMRFGTEKADEEGWLCYVNGSKEGKGVYERFDFKTVEESDFGSGIHTWHMMRDAKSLKVE